MEQATYAGTVHAAIRGSSTWRVWNVDSDLRGLLQCAALRREGNIDARYYPRREK